MVHGVVAYLVTPIEQSINAAPIEELYRWKVQRLVAESGHRDGITLI